MSRARAARKAEDRERAATRGLQGAERREAIRVVVAGQSAEIAGNRELKWRRPEHKGMATRGIRLAGKITLRQYLRLIELGMDGEKIKGWTAHRASKEISRRGSCAACAAGGRDSCVPPENCGG